MSDHVAFPGFVNLTDDVSVILEPENSFPLLPSRILTTGAPICCTMIVVLTVVERTRIESVMNTVSIDVDDRPFLGYVYNDGVCKSVGSTTPHVLDSTGNTCTQLHLKVRPAADPLTPTRKDKKVIPFA